MLQIVPLARSAGPLNGPADVAPFAARVRAERGALMSLPTPPLMHGTALNVGALPSLSVGGAVALLTSARSIPPRCGSSCEREAMLDLNVVGDAFARPLLTELMNGPSRLVFVAGDHFLRRHVLLRGQDGSAWIGSHRAR